MTGLSNRIDSLTVTLFILYVRRIEGMKIRREEEKKLRREEG